jgi:hypothetical protein
LFQTTAPLVVERRFAHLIIEGISTTPMSTAIQPTYAPEQPSKDASVLKTIVKDRWASVTFRNAIGKLPETVSVFGSAQQ